MNHPLVENIFEKIATENKNHSSSFDLGGTQRAFQAEKTLAWITPTLPSFGITRVANLTGLDDIGIPVYAAIRPNSKHLSNSQGKGHSDNLAKISAIMESIEGYHMENARPADISGSYTELHQQYPLLHLNVVNEGAFSLKNLLDTPMEWLAAADITNKKTIYIPHALVSIECNKHNPQWGYFAVNSNGLASGNTFCEAVCHGLYELIERNNFYLWSQLSNEEKQKTCLDNNSIEVDALQHLINQFTEANIQVLIWDITEQVKVPSFYCLIRHEKINGPHGQYFGCGTHLDKNIALSRALTEAAQSRVTLISGSRDDIFYDQYYKQQLQQRRILNQTLAVVSGSKKYSSCLQPEISTNLAKNIELICEHITQQGYQQIIIHDHTKTEFDIPVAHVFIPGMKFTGFRV